MGQPAAAVRLLRISWTLAALFAVRVRPVVLRSAGVRRGLWPRLGRQRPPTVRLLTGVVGPERIAIIVAWITVIHQIGSASAAYLGGVLRIAFGTYLEAFIFSGVLLIAAALMVLFVGAASRGRSPQVAATSLGSVP